MNLKKIGSAVLTATTVLWMVGAASLPLANAQTTASLQAQIAALLAQIQQLQSQLGTSGTTTTGTTYDFTSDLTVGSTGAQVTALQQLLINDGYLTAVSAPTGYFGTLTQAALGKFQAANGISPDAGYFGPITRAFINSMSTTTTTTTTTSGSLPAGCTSTSGYSSTTGVSCSTGTSSVVAPSTGLAVSLASSNPAAGSLISSSGSGSGRVPVMAFNLTAGNSGAVTVSSLSFQQEGVLSESAIAGAYLTQNGQVVAQYSSLNNDVLTFTGLQLSIPAGQTETYDLAINVSSGLSAGNTTSFALPSASDVSAWDTNNNAITPSGSFPLTGNVFTVTTVSNPSLATLTVQSSSIGTTVTAGTQGNIVGAWTFQVANSPVWLQNINFHVIGSANDANIQNVKLLVNGTQVGATLPQVPANGMADFNTTSTSVELNTGSNNIQIVADVMGSPSDNFQFEILNNYDVLAVDSQYNVPISVTNTSGTGTQVQIQVGQITLNQDPNTPTGNIAKGTSGVVLAKYDLYAAGEPVKVQFLDFNIAITGVATTTGSASTTLNDEIQNVSITDDAGNQVGTTINQPPSAATCSNAQDPSGYTAVLPGTDAGNANIAGAINQNVSYEDCFGSASSPINYIVPANTTRVLSLKADIENTASFNTITANLSGDTNNLQGMISSQTNSTSQVGGVALSLVSSSLGASQNNALGTQNVSAGTTGLEIGSYALSASSAGGVNVNTVSILLAPTSSVSTAYTVPFQNLKILVNGVQFGTTQGVVTGNSTYVFSGSAFNVPAGSTVDVNVYADTTSNGSGLYSPATELTGFTGVGQTSYTSVTDTNGNINGQNVSFSGNPSLQISADSTNPPAGQIVQNSTGDTLAVYRFTETSNVENVKVTQFTVSDVVSPAVSSTKAAFSNVQLWNGSTLLGTAGSPTWDSVNNSWDYTFSSFNNPLIVPQGNSVSLTLKGNAGSNTNGSITDGSTASFDINLATSTITALGATSNRSAIVTLSGALGNPQTILRSTIAVAATPVSGNPPASLQQIGSVTFTANAAGDTKLNNLSLTFNSTAGNATTTGFMPTVVLKDPSGNDIVAVDNLASSSYSGSASTTKTWTFATSTTSLVITAGSSYTLTVWGDLSQIPAIANTAQSLTASVSSTSAFGYYDGTNGTGSSTPILVNLTSNQVPITVVSLTTPVGGQF